MFVYVRVPRETSDGPLTFDAAWALAPDLPRGSLLLGQDDSGAQVVLDMSNPGNVHCAVIGMTGSGKSTLMQTMALSLLKAGGAQVALLDPTRNDSKLWPLSGHPSIWRGGMYATVSDIERALAEIRQHSGGDLFVFVDEAPSLAQECSAIGNHLRYLTASGRHGGVHLILGAQGIDDHGKVFENVSARLVGRVVDAGIAYRAAGRNDSGAEHLRGGGDFVSCTGAGLRHFQAAMCGPLADYTPRRGQPFVATGPPARVTVTVMQSTAPLEAELVGRGVDKIKPSTIRDIMVYRSQHGRWPTPRHCEDWLHIRRYKAKRAINLACLRCRLPLEYPDWQNDYRVEAKLEVGR